MTAGAYCPDPPQIDRLTERVLHREPNVAPAVRSRKMREWTNLVRNMVDDVRRNWDTLPAEKREWLRLWAIDELPRPGLVERFLFRVAGGIVYAAHPDDVSDFLAEGKLLRESILEKIAETILRRTVDDEGFAQKFSTGIEELTAGKGIAVTLDEL